MMSRPPDKAEPRSRSAKLQLVAVALFVFVNLLMPVLFDDLYPFTRGPMFRDQPVAYCEYRVIGPDGNQLPVEDFQLQRVYDGNPPGVGVGVKPPATLNEFGKIAEAQVVIDHVQQQLDSMPQLPYVDVEQQVIGPVSKNRVGVVETRRWRVDRKVD